MAIEEPISNRLEKEHALETVLKSRTFVRSEQLQAFLRYVCDLELAGRGDGITEYSIATGALHRKRDYAPGEDSSVRTRAHALRRKLHQCYETELPGAEWRIEIPKGSYRPLFVNRCLAPCSSVPAALEPAVVRVPRPRRRRPPWVLVAVVAALVPVTFWIGRSRSDRVDSTVREAWGPVLAPPGDVLVVVASPPVARIVPSQPGVPPPAGRLMEAPELISEWYEQQKLENRGGPVYIFPTRAYMVMADAVAVARVAALLSEAGVGFQTVAENKVQPMAIHERGMVLIGSPAYTPFLARLQKLTPLAVRFDPESNEEVISDGPPGRAKKVFSVRRDAVSRNYATVYGLITVLPSQPGREHPKRTILFSGIMGSPGAQAGIEYFTSAGAMRDLKARFAREGHAGFPSAYQVVVRCGVDGNIAMNVVYETHRVMETVPLIE